MIDRVLDLLMQQLNAQHEALVFVYDRTATKKRLAALKEQAQDIIKRIDEILEKM